MSPSEVNNIPLNDVFLYFMSIKSMNLSKEYEALINARFTAELVAVMFNSKENPSKYINNYMDSIKNRQEYTLTPKYSLDKVQISKDLISEYTKYLENN